MEVPPRMGIPASHLVVFTLALLLSGTARATTFVLADTPDLARAADAIVIGRVSLLESVTTSRGRIHTRVTVLVEETLKGSFPSGVLTLREPGGRLGSLRRVTHGAARFEPGERVLLLLRRGRDGTLHTLHMAMGKFGIELDPVTGVENAVRDFGRARAFTPQRRRLPRRDRRRLQEVVDEIRGVVRQRARARNLDPVSVPLDDPAVITQPPAAFTIFPTPVRWFEPDAGLPVGLRLDPAGDLELGPAVSTTAVEDALAAWSGIASASIVLQNAGSATPSPISTCDGESKIVFNDPFDEIDPPIGCSGTLALGGGCFTSSESTLVNGTVFFRRTEGDIVFSDGFALSCNFKTPCNFAEVATHEIGHVIGLDHSSEDLLESVPDLLDATMYFRAQFDGRCAEVRADDILAATFIYPVPGGSFCGDGITDSGEGCDDGNSKNGDGCDNNCTTTSCGNGILTLGEQCDDANLTSGDGCNELCQLEDNAPNSDRQDCINVLNKHAARIANAQGKQVIDCIKDYEKNKLPGTIQDCIDADPGSRVAKAIARAQNDEFKKCLLAPPSFGASNAASVASGATTESVELVYDLFGADLDLGMISNDKDRAAAKCQRSVLKQVEKCRDAWFTEFNRCKKLGMKHLSILSSDALEQCMGKDARGKIAVFCNATFGRVVTMISKRCGNVDLVDGFPGCAAADPVGLSSCIERSVNCRACRAMNEADHLNRDCDVFDNGNADSSCPGCGNGVLEPDEDCDDGNTNSCDGCSALCQVEIGLVCGDGIQNVGCSEECDDGNTINEDGCSAVCLKEVCGDGVLQTLRGEQCDDGNTQDGDCCSSGCQIEPPSTLCRPAAGSCDLEEFCTAASPNCPFDVKSSSVCRPSSGSCDLAEVCDGINNFCPIDQVLPGGSSCDDFSSCTGPDQCVNGSCIGGLLCGDGTKQGLCGEECDDSNLLDGDGCSSLCILEFCGDGIVQTGIGEVCDDGGVVPGDGCDASCQTEEALYSEAFTEGVPAAPQCLSWDTFRTGLADNNYTRITIRGSNDPTGITCVGQEARQICQALKTGSPAAVVCGSRVWRVGTCGGVELSAEGTICQCQDPGYVVRPCHPEASWGAVNSATCSPPTQTIEVVCGG